eukprot:scaffold158148_cov30-Tisochrysis_lutea.AAC.7
MLVASQTCPMLSRGNVYGFSGWAAYGHVPPDAGVYAKRDASPRWSNAGQSATNPARPLKREAARANAGRIKVAASLHWALKVRTNSFFGCAHIRGCALGLDLGLFSGLICASISHSCAWLSTLLATCARLPSSYYTERGALEIPGTTGPSHYSKAIK